MRLFVIVLFCQISAAGTRSKPKKSSPVRCQIISCNHWSRYLDSDLVSTTGTHFSLPTDGRCLHLTAYLYSPNQFRFCVTSSSDLSPSSIETSPPVCSPKTATELYTITSRYPFITIIPHPVTVHHYLGRLPFACPQEE
jgi:hypothetical protein